MSDKAQLQRFEMKYLVSEEKALSIRRFLLSYLKPDDFAATLPNFSYPVHSLYLDSPDLATYQAVQCGDRNRFKLRIRYYDETPDAPVFFEIKKRINECIGKQRAKVRRDAVEDLLAGRPPQMAHLIRPDARQLVALQDFCRLVHKLQASPRSHVAYMREAWMSPLNNSIRVTFDRQVQCEPEFRPALTTQIGDAVTAFGHDVVLELKFTNRLPQWCIEMVRVFQLVRSGAPKYVRGISLLGEHRVSNRGVSLKVPVLAGAQPERWGQSEPLAVAAA
ncbi:MAG: polyphosphate polymerase domain-containing protein [Opitutaceae bacterium]|nr:polyphosphate polymerase domain-containing protein [Opitutaceae bacterium]